MGNCAATTTVEPADVEAADVEAANVETPEFADCARGATERAVSSKTPSRRRRSSMSLIITLALLMLGGVAVDVGALTPQQNSTVGITNVLWPNLDTYWRWEFSRRGRSYTKPKGYYYNYNGQHYTSTCGVHTSNWVNNAFYCTRDRSINIDYQWGTRLAGEMVVTRGYWGDYAFGGILAHEWGHHVASQFGKPLGTEGSELAADCLSGVFTAWAAQVGLLDASDADEMRSWLYYRGTSVGHSTGPTRLAWFDYGRSARSLEGCISRI